MAKFNKDSVSGTISVVVLLSLVCSVIVAGSAVLLKSTQEKQKALDKQKNILSVSGLLKKALSFAVDDVIVRLEFAEVTTLVEKMKKYYKLYSLMENKLFSKFGDRKYIELNKEYYAQDPHYKLCFADINHILDYM